jgi:kynurenine formamidase
VKPPTVKCTGGAWSIQSPILVAILALVLVVPPGCSPPASDPPPLDESDPSALAHLIQDARMVELTHPLSEETLVWPTSRPFEFEVTFEGVTDEGFYYLSRDFSGPEHGGTHLDAPIHFYEGRWTTDQIPLERLVGPGVVVDVSGQADSDPNYQVSLDDLLEWEEVHGRIPAGAIVLLNTGRSQFWGDARAYMGTEVRGEEGLARLQFPGLHPEGARWLARERDIVAVGLDTPSLDYGPSTTFESHQILFEQNIYGLENVANLDELPPFGSTILALPSLMEGGSGGPVRIIGLVP